MEDGVLRILVATDNHLGYCERDPIRCDDSLAAFEEILQTAKQRQVDFILLAGDLFHENKPSRRTLHATIELLRTYCLGDDPVFIEILNDQKEIFKNSFGKANYEDPFQSVSLPIFAIHGNHDDPSREGGLGDALAALDILSASNLINYFGKADSVEYIEITPILIRKGQTNVAIYGLGAMRDERLNRMWNMKKVRFVRLTAEQGRDDFFNIFLLHQNRDLGRGTKNCIHESMIPEWMDLVIWGNEHECQPHLAESLVGTYRILQPGSSVATSLGYTESSQFPKHMAFIEIKEKKFRMTPVRFSQVRQFIYQEIALRDFEFLHPTNPKIEEQIKSVLTTRVNEMIVEGRSAIQEVLEADQRYAPKYKIREPQKVLLRLKLDYSGFSVFNFPRFTAQFAQDVANAINIILPTKRSKDILRPMGAKATALADAQEDIMKQLLDDDDMPKIRIEDLINETLSSSKHSLSLLAESEVAQALEDYIVKKELHAIEDLVSETLERTQALLKNDKTALVEKDAIANAAEKIKQKKEADIKRAGPAPTGGKGYAASSLIAGDISNRTIDDNEDDVDAARVSRRGLSSSRKELHEEEDMKIGHNESDEEDEILPVGKKRGSANATKKSSAATKSKAAPKTQASKRAGGSSNSMTNSKSKQAISAESSKSTDGVKKNVRAAAMKAKKYVEPIEFGSDEDEEIQPSARSGAAKKRDISDEDVDEDEIMDVEEIEEQDEDEDEEEARYDSRPQRRGKSQSGIASGTTINKPKDVAGRKTSKALKSLPVQTKSTMKQRAEIISLEDDGGGDDSMSTGKSGSSEFPQSNSNYLSVSYNTAPASKKRQLPLSFSQTEKKATALNKLAAGWDD